MTQPTCETCRFFEVKELAHSYGDCRRMPPQFNFSAYFTEDGYYTPKRIKVEISRFREGVWPNCSNDSWCGEHKLKEKADQ